MPNSSKDKEPKNKGRKTGTNVDTRNTEDEASHGSSDEETMIGEQKNNQMEKLVKTVETLSLNVSSLIPILKKIESNTRQLQSNAVNITDAVGPKLQEQFQSIEKVLKEIADTDKQSPSTSTQESAQILIENEAEKVKASILDSWNSKLISRSKHFWQKVRNANLSKVYESWRNTMPIILPKKLQMIEIKDEPDNQR